MIHKLTFERAVKRYPDLAQRTAEMVKYVHYLRRPDGLLCLDCNILRATEDELDTAVLDHLEDKLADETLLTPAPVEDWKQATEHTHFIGTRAIYRRRKVHSVMVVTLSLTE